jgi:hypothetical protein
MTLIFQKHLNLDFKKLKCQTLTMRSAWLTHSKLEYKKTNDDFKLDKDYIKTTIHLSTYLESHIKRPPILSIEPVIYASVKNL